jgi:hypothetical protein
LPGAEALGLPEPTSLRGHAVIAPGRAACLPLAEQLRGGIAAGMPALEPIRCRGVEHTRPAIAAASASRTGRTPKVRRHRAPIQPKGRRHGPRRPALVVQGPALLMQRLPAGLVWRGARRLRPGPVVGRPRHGACPIRERHRLLALRRMDGGEAMPRRDAHLRQGVPEMLAQMDAIRALGGGGSPLAGALGRGAPAVPGDHLAPGLSLEPLGDGLGVPLRQERDGLAAFASNAHRAIRLACAARDIVPPKDRGGGSLWPRELAQDAPPRVPTPRHVPGVAQQRAGPPPERQTKGDQALDPPPRPPGPRRGHRREPFREEAAPTGKVCTTPCADTSRQAHTIRCPRQIGQRAAVAAMDARGRHSADRTRHNGLGGGHRDGEQRRGGVETPGVKAA